jgi:hypothetical protein
MPGRNLQPAFITPINIPILMTTLHFHSASSVLLACLLFTASASAEAPNKLEFAVTKGTNPDGGGGYTGKLTFARTGAEQAFKAAWTLSNGTAAGWAIPFPGSDYIAVGYGKDLGGVVIYQRQKDASSKAHYATAAEGEKITSYTLAPGKERGQFTMKDGAEGAVAVTPKAERVFDLTWTIGGTAWQGMGVADGDFLAAASTTGGKDYGVVIYKKTAAGATGWWRYGGAPGVGTEELKITSVDGVTDAPAADPKALATEVQKIAKSLRGDGALLLKLKPTAAQIAAIAATMEDAALLADYTEKLFASLPAGGLTAKDGQTAELVVGPADLPGGYQQQAAHFSKDVAIYGFKYVAPGETIGMAYDGLVLVDGKWVMIPKMWRAFAK